MNTETTHNQAFLIDLVKNFCKLEAENPCVEFKHNKRTPSDIGEYISALSNAAVLNQKENAYMIWGIQDGTHNILGTEFNPDIEKGKGNELLLNWLTRLLQPKINFQFQTIAIENKKVVVLTIPKATSSPTKFNGEAWIRIGSSKRMLKDLPEHEKKLWLCFDQTTFEEKTVREHCSTADALSLIDFSAYFDQLHLPIPSTSEAIAETMAQDNMLVKNDAGTWNITNLGALLFAKNLSDFGRLSRKSIRVISYKGKNRLETNKEHVFTKGYATSFQQTVEYIENLLPNTETITKGIRRDILQFPLIAIRELVANAIIHQDFSITGTGPMIEIFENRIEITNPGSPLIQIERFIDNPPRSRNENMAAFMRRIGICEERGSGIDKVISAVESNLLPAPEWEPFEDSLRVTLFQHKGMREMSIPERIHACYLHACLKYVSKERMTNASFRERLGIKPENSAMISRIIKEALKAGCIKPYSLEQGRRNASYVPYWA